MTELILFWHRRDLRIHDNIGLSMARKRSAKVVGVFCFDPAILRADDVAAVRVDYLLGSLVALRDRYQAAGSDLLFLQADPIVGLPQLAQALSAAALYWNWDVEPYAQQRDQKMIQALQGAGIEAHTEWDQLLHTPYEIVSKAKREPYTVYGPFWKNWVVQPKLAPHPELTGVTGLDAAEPAIAQAHGVIAIPTLADLGFAWDQGQILAPGELPALKMLATFTDKAIADYDEARNFPAQPGTSSLSPAMKFGTIGIRTVWAATQTAMAAAKSDASRLGVRTWQQELAWREFYQHVMFHFPQLADGPYREHFKQFPWQTNTAHFQAWCEGKTGYPIVDAAMRQLNATGWMHNRCRMIVASFLTKDLILDWRWGEKYFMQHLVDGDLSANNGGWQWSASSGMDPKPLRIFNPASQAKKFDPNGDYIRQWVPELRPLKTADLISGEIDPIDRKRTGYPRPIVDHSVQQREFKARYAQQKSKVTDSSDDLS
jgi:deoxyribodipyrimidine photo-lyase